MRKRVNFMRNAVMYVLVALFMLVSAFALIHAVGFHDAEPRVSSEAAETVLTPAQKAQFFTPYYEEATVYLTDPRGKSLSIYRVNEYGGTVILDQWSSGGTANMLGYKVKNGGYMVVYAPYGTAVSSGAIMQCSSSSTAITLLTNITDGRIVVNSARYQNLYVDNDGYIYMKAYNAVSTTSAQLKEWSKAYFTKDGAVSWHSSSSDCLNINMSTGGGTGGSGGTGGGSSGLTPQSALAMAGIDGNHLPYTGQEHNFTTENTWVKLAKTLGGSSVIFAGDTNKTNAGTYTLVALLGGGDYKMVTWYIDKADPVAETYQQTVETTPGQEISADTLLKFTSPFDPTKDGGKFTITVEPSGSKAVSVTGSGDLSALKLTGGSETGTATVKISYAGGTNLNGKTWSFRVTNSLSSEIYTGTGDAKTTYPTLEEAVKAVEAGTAAGPIYVNGTVEVGSPIAVSKDITITQGDKADMPAELKLTASAGSMFEVQGGGVLTLQAVAAKGVPQNPTSLVSLTGGALTLENVSVESFGNSAVAANGAGAKITLAGENTFASCGASAAKAQNGGAISLTGGAVLTAAEEGASVTFNGCMAAENGGAIYAEEATVEAANLAITATGCSAATGGAIYLGSGTTAGIHESTYIENNSAAKANGVYVADGSTLTLPTAANDINDGIMLGYTASDEKNASIVLSGEAPEAGKTIIVEFEDPANQVEDFSKYITSEGNALSAADMKGFMRVKNAGYTFDPNAADGSLHLRPTSDNVAAYYDGTKWVPCASLQAAIDAVAATSTSEDPGKVALYQYRNTQTEGGQIYGGDLEILEKLTIPAGAHITLGSITGTVSESGGNAEYDEEVDPFTLKRGTSLTDEMIKVEKGASLTLTNVILDGGAVWNKDKPETPAYSDWTAQAGKVKIADDGNGGAGTVETNNTGVVAHAPVIVNQGTLNIGEGATIQNNDNNWAMPGVGFGSQNYGGGVRNEGQGTLNMTGGLIQDCYSREGGAIMNVNKPENTNGTPNPNYVDPAQNGGHGPQVNITGGKITGNVSQMKGAAVQSIYGGAETTVSENAEITGNVSLHDLGVLSVEEGASLTVSGGTVSAVEPSQNALYLYNQYSAEDYAGATTKPYIEGNGAGKLAVSGNPAISGNVYLDASCYAVDGKASPDAAGNYPASDRYYETYVDVTGFTGDSLSVAFEKTEEGQAASDGAIAKAKGTVAETKALLDKLNIKETASAGFANTFYFRYPEGEMTVLAQSSYSLEVSQTEANKLTVSGVLDVPNCTKATFTVGEKVYTVSASPAAGEIRLNADGTFTFDVEGLTATNQTAELALFYWEDDAADVTVKDLPLEVVVVDEGNLKLPEGWKYVPNDGEPQTWGGEGIPADIKIDDQGNATFQDKDGEEKQVKVGSRAEDPDLTGAQFTLEDVTSTSLTLGVDEKHQGLEYTLQTADGKFLTDEDGKEVWLTAKDGTLGFTGLAPDTVYTLYARTPAGETAVFPGLPVSCIHSYLTLTAEQQTARENFERAYAEHFNGTELKNKKVPSTELAKVMEAYADLETALNATATEELQNFLEEARKTAVCGFEKDKKDALEAAYDLRRAEEWFEENGDYLKQAVNYATGEKYSDVDNVEGAQALATLKGNLKAAETSYEKLEFAVLQKLADLLYENGYAQGEADSKTPLPEPLTAYLMLAQKEMQEKVDAFLKDDAEGNKREQFGPFCDQCVEGIAAARTMDEADRMLQNFELAQDAVDALQKAYEAFVKGQTEPNWEDSFNADLVKDELAKQYVALAKREYQDADKTDGKLSEEAKAKIAAEATAAFTLADQIGDAKRAYVAAFNAAIDPKPELTFAKTEGKETAQLDLTPYAEDPELSSLVAVAQRAVDALDGAKSVAELNKTLQSGIADLLDSLLTLEELSDPVGSVSNIVKAAKAEVKTAIEKAGDALIEAETLAAAVKGVKAEIEAQRLKDDAVAQYKAAHKAITGAEADPDDATLQKLTGSDMGTADALNEVLKEGVNGLLETATEGDEAGSLAKEYASALAKAVENAEPNARGIAQVAAAVDGAKENFEFLRAKEEVLAEVEEAYNAEKDGKRVSEADAASLSEAQTALQSEVNGLKLEPASLEDGAVYETWAQALTRMQGELAQEQAKAQALKQNVLKAIAKEEYAESYKAIMGKAASEAEITAFEAATADMGTAEELNEALSDAISDLLRGLRAEENGESEQSKALQDLIAAAQQALAGVTPAEGEIADFSAEFEAFENEGATGSFGDRFAAQREKELEAAIADYFASYKAATGVEVAQGTPYYQEIAETFKAAETTKDLNAALYLATANLLENTFLAKDESGNVVDDQAVQKAVADVKDEVYTAYTAADVAATRFVPTLSGIVEAGIGTIAGEKVQSSVDAAVKEYTARYTDIYGKAPEAADKNLENIGKATSAQEADKRLKDAVVGLLEGHLTADKDSKAVQDIVNDAIEAVNEAAADPRTGISDLENAIAGFVNETTGYAAQVAKEQQAAQDAYLAFYNGLHGTTLGAEGPAVSAALAEIAKNSNSVDLNAALQQAIADLLEEYVRDDVESVKQVANGAKEEAQKAVAAANGGASQDKGVVSKDTLKEIAEKARADVAFERLREQAKQEYDELYKAANGETATPGEGDEALAAIEKATKLEELNNALGNAAKEFLDEMGEAGDSTAAQKVITDAQGEVEKAVETANGAGNIADVSEIVEAAKAALEKQRLDDAKADLEAAYEKAYENLTDSSPDTTVTEEFAKQLEPATTEAEAEGIFKEALKDLIDEAAKVDGAAPAEGSNLAAAVADGKGTVENYTGIPEELADEMKGVKAALEEAKAHDDAIADLAAAKQDAKEKIEAAHAAVSQSGMTDPAKAALEKAKAAALDAVDDVTLNKEAGKSWADALEAAEAELDKIVKGAQAELPAIRYRDLAAKEYAETYVAAKGEADPGFAEAKEKFANSIAKEQSLDNINEALGNAAKDFLDEMGETGDSQAAQKVITDAKTAVDKAVAAATTAGNIADVSEIVKAAKAALEAQRAADALQKAKEDAKQAVQEAYDEILEASGTNMDGSSKTALDAAKQRAEDEIDAAQTADEPAEIADAAIAKMGEIEAAGIAKKDYLDSKAVLGVEPAGGEKAVLDKIDAAKGNAERNAAVKEAVNELLDSMKQGGDSAAAKAIVDEAKKAVEAAVTAADEKQDLADISEVVKSVKADLEAQRALDAVQKAKDAAKQAVQEAYDEILAESGTNMDASSKTALEAAKQRAEDEIDAAQTADEPAEIADVAIAEMGEIEAAGIAKKDYLDSKAVLGVEPAGGEKAVLNAIDAAKDNAGRNAAVKEAVNELLDSMKQDGDSAAAEAIVDEAKKAVEAAVTAADEKQDLADISEVVKSVKADLEAQRALDAVQKAKDAKKAEIAELLEQAPAGAEETVQKFQEAADAAIEAASDEELDDVTEQLKDRIEEKLAVLDHLEEKKEAGAAAGVPAAELANLDDIADGAYAAIDEAETAEEAHAAAEEGKRDISRSYAESYLEEEVKDDVQSVQDAITGAGGYLDEIRDAATAEEADALLEEAQDAIEGERFLDGNEALSKPFDDVDRRDASALKETETAFDKLPSGVKEYLDGKSQQSGYSGTKGELSDREARAAFEETKANLLEEADTLLHEHDGEFVKETHAEKVNELKDLEYTPHTADETRAKHLEEEEKRLDDAYAAAKQETEHAQRLQRFANQAAQEAEARGNNGQYNEPLKAQLMDVAAEYSERAKEIPSSSDDAAEKALDDLFEEFLEALDEVPVIRASAGKINPDGTFAGEGEAEYDDYDGNLWGRVENEATMPGGIRLIIEETEEDREAIHSAIASSKIVAAEGSDLIDETVRSYAYEKEVVATVDIYLLKNDVIKITEFEGMYLVSMLLPQSLRSMHGLQLVYIGEDTVEVYETKIVEGKYLEFKTAHFSEFVLLAEHEINLWWLVILLACILVSEIVILLSILLKKEESDKTMFLSVAPLGALLTVLIPTHAFGLCIALGIADVAGLITILVAVRLKRADREKWEWEQAEAVREAEEAEAEAHDQAAEEPAEQPEA